MNIHHLELFYHVAKHKGIAQAVRHIPYGIQQPAISSQLILLEKEIQTSLFHRRPFALTPAGEELFQFIQPFFGQVQFVSDKLKGQLQQKLSLAASPTILRNYVPEIVAEMRQDFPTISLSTRLISPPQAAEVARDPEIDLVISILEKNAEPGLKYRRLLELSLILLVPLEGAVNKAAQLLIPEEINQRALISLPKHEPLSELFNLELSKRKLKWEPKIEVNSLEEIHHYVNRKFGIGLAVDIPGQSLPLNLKALPLPGFPKIVIGVVHRPQLSPLAQAFFQRLNYRASLLISR